MRHLAFHVIAVKNDWMICLGIVPGAGDAADAVLNYVLVVRKAQQAEYVTPS